MGTNPNNHTPERILEAARTLFAERGYERTTIRGIGAHAGVDPALVVHYFGNKDSLFAKAVRVGLEVPDLRQMEGYSAGACLVSYFLDAMEKGGTGTRLIALLRACVSQESAMQTLQTIIQRRLQNVLAELLPADEIGLRSGLIATQMVGLAMTRYILKIPSVAGLPKDEVIQRLGPVIQHHLFSYMGDLVRPSTEPLCTNLRSAQR